MKKLLAIVLAAVLALSCCAFAETDADGALLFDSGVDTSISATITIYTYYADSSITTVDYAVNKMKEKYPNLQFEIVHRADSDGSAIKTWAATGALPDLMDIASADTYDILLSNNDLYDVSEVAEDLGYWDYFNNGDLYKAAHSEADGSIYGIGTDVSNVFTVYYNLSVFEELGLSEPTNFDEFKNCITVLKENGKIPIALFGAEQWPGMALFELACIAEGALTGSNPVNDGEIKYADDPAYARAAAKFQEIVELGAFGTGALSTNASQAFELESSGQAGFVCNGSWHWSTTETEGYADNIGYCHFNVFADADKAEEVKDYAVGGHINRHSFAVNANPPCGLDAATVAALGMEYNYYVYAESGILGLRTTAKGNFTFNGGAAFTDFNNNFANIKSFSVYPQDMSNGSLVSALGNAVEMMVSGNYTADDFMAEMAAAGF